MALDLVAVSPGYVKDLLWLTDRLSVGKFERPAKRLGIGSGTRRPLSNQLSDGEVHRGVENCEGGRVEYGDEILVVTPPGVVFFQRW